MGESDVASLLRYDFLPYLSFTATLRHEIMDQMLLLHGQEEANFLLRHAFKKLIPPAVRHALAAFPATNPCAWAREADRLMVNHEERFLVAAAIRSPSPACSLPLTLIEASPVLAVVAPPTCWCTRLPPPCPTPQMDRNQDPKLCYFHRRFGAAAQNC